MGGSSMTAAILLAGAFVIAPGQALADTSGCVTRAEFHRVSDGMTKERVRAIFDTTGFKGPVSISPNTGTKSETHRYTKCTEGISLRFLTVTYVKKSGLGEWRVTRKHW